MSIFVSSDQKTLIIRRIKKKSGLLKILDKAAGFPYGRPSDQHLRRFTSSHAACNRRAIQKLCFGPEKLINSTLFAAGGNNTLELISNQTAEVEFLNIIYISKFS